MKWLEERGRGVSGSPWGSVEFDNQYNVLMAENVMWKAPPDS